MEDKFYLHAFNLLPQFGPARLMHLAGYFGNFSRAYQASESQLAAAGIEPEISRMFLSHREKIDLAEEIKKLEAENIHILDFRDSNYPKLLLEISKFPPIIYYKGTMLSAEELCVSVVGTRMITNYGRTVIPYAVGPLADAGLTLVSGLAYGVDSAVQQLAVQKGRRTIAVLGGGLDEKAFYPKEHVWLAEEILKCGGAILSEHPIGTPPLKHHFVSRNRIISGLSVATIIIECNLKSGSLITAKYALEQNRAVFAVPGPIFADTSKGPNNLIKMGARPLTSANDILEELNLKRLPEEKTAQQMFGDSPAETLILKILGFEPVHINELIKQSEMAAQEIMSALTFLEIKGKVRNLGGQQYVLAR
ncbi:MAG: DNA-processing protein DprA [Patescibacteria group bacterium]|nr:DNA-processing protein DprA [Patescibacteria group bacterium]